MVMNNVKKGLASPYSCKNTQNASMSSVVSGTSSFAISLFGTAPTFTKSITRTSGSSYNGCWVDVGYGDTAVTADDYKLANGNMKVTTGSTVTLDGTMELDIVSSGQNTKSDGQFINFTVTLKNNTDHTVTVKEIGLYAQCNSHTSSQNSICLMFRKVLSTPIVFASGDQYAITYAISLNI